ncbi:interleukin-27 subunit beta isoform X2 [Elgaria multicarinata webbii]|uniref:interleukin-27 subunit beta isoform X2 n=1 Tax=Elgaria multicarinata webbii TaxID=159646 RepID=UPI002FCD6171
MADSLLLMVWTLILGFALPANDAGGLLEEAGPTEQHYANLGVPEVVFSCPLPEGPPAVKWKVNGTSPGLSTLARGDGSLALHNTSLDQEGEYTCHETATGRVLRRVHLKLGYPPEKPSVQCRSASYPSVNCAWSLGTEPHLDTSFFSTYRHGIEGEVSECVQPFSGANSCSIANMEMFSVSPYILNVTAVNPLGTTTSLFIIFLDQILKPDPPEDLKVSPIPGERKKLHLEWKPPSSWLLLEYFPLKYSVRYWRFGSRSSKTTRATEETSLVLTGIRPGGTYHIQVAAMDFLDNGEWSVWSSPATGTPWMPE